MTTIAYKDGIMAADSKICGASTTMGSHKKLYVDDDLGLAMGFTGDAQYSNGAFEWFKDLISGKIKTHNPPHCGECAGYVYFNKTIHRFECDLIPYEIEAEFFAAGSGDELSLGAMAAGATAVEALKIACKYNIYTGGDIMAYDCINKKWLDTKQ